MNARRNLCLSRPAGILCPVLAALVCIFFTNAPADADTIYVANHNDGTIVKFDSDGSESVFASGLHNPLGLALDSSGNLYAADSANSRILKFDASGNASVFAITGIQLPSGLAFDNSGNLYVAIQSFNAIVKFNSSGSMSFFATSGLSRPAGLAFDSHGNLFAANAGNNTIEKFDTNGVGTVFASTGLNFPQGLEFDSSGSLCVANSLNREIDKFDSNGTSTLFASTLSYPQGLAFDSSGNLFVSIVENANIILKVDPTGHWSVFASGLSGPSFIAIQFTKPTITLLGNNPLTNECHTAFYDPGATASEDGTDLSSNIVVSGSVNANAPGPYTLTYTVTDALDNCATATRTVVVVDSTAPVIDGVRVDKAVLWPPNHKLVNVTVDYSARDACSDVDCSLSVTSNEALSDTDAGDGEPDWVIVDAQHVLLRAERAASGNGRDYTISVTCTDSSGNISSEAVDVTVPKSQRM